MAAPRSPRRAAADVSGGSAAPVAIGFHSADASGEFSPSQSLDDGAEHGELATDAESTLQVVCPFLYEKNECFTKT